jgi:lauroyl/myristoyl acyltransferase
MAIDLQQMINSPSIIRFVSVLARAVPPAVGYPVCDLIGRWTATRRQSSITQAVRLNQWMARGACLESKQLDWAVTETLQNNVRDLFDLYHYIERPEVAWRLTRMNPLAEELVGRPEFAGRGLMLVSIHLSSFDSILLSMHHRGAKGLLLTIPNPQGGRRVEYEMRSSTGMKILPASLNSFRQAVRHLKQGGLVVTAIDRSVPGVRLRPRFFGQPAQLSTHHIYLALKARVPVVVMAVIRQPDGKYKIVGSELMEIEQHTDHESTVLHNAERVLEKAESFIRQAPQQWNVPLPIWPELLGEVPNG